MKNIQYLTPTQMVAKFNEACASSETFTVSFYSVKSKPTHKSFASKMRSNLFKAIYNMSVNNLTSKDVQKKTMTTALENVLQEKLLKLLKKMGVKTLDLTTYIEKYSQKNGVAPSASALADLGQKIVAFKDGKITAEDLNEETAHFIIASTPKAELENILSEELHT